jgi:hypothetical protein
MRKFLTTLSALVLCISIALANNNNLLIQTFLGNADTPNSYSGEGGNCAIVNVGETALEFGSCGAGSGAPTDATYITQTPDATLSAEQALSALATGIVKNTTTTGVLSIAAEGTDYYEPGGTAVASGDMTTATTSAQGASELATTAEVNTGTDTGRTITPDALAGSNLGTARGGLVLVASDTAVATGDGTEGIPAAASMNGMDIINVVCTVHDKGITGTTDIQLRRRRAGSDVDVLSTKVTIGDEFFAQDGVINTSNDDIATGDIFYFDIDAIHSGTAPNGLSCVFEARLP